MSTLMEDRLSAALAARAEQVQPEDLRPLEVPVPSPRHRRQLLLGLAAAACTLAVLVPLALAGEDGNVQPPPANPSGPTTAPQPDVQQRDVDGDGGLDDVWLETSGDRYSVMVRLADGNLVRSDGQAHTTAELMPEADLNRDGAADLVVRLSEDPSVMPAVYSWLTREGLVRAPFPDEALEGWRPGMSTNRWAVSDDGGLRTWESDPVPGDTRVPYWDWSLDEQVRLRPGLIQLGCVSETDAAPELCEGPAASGKADPGMGPRGDLPRLFPQVEEQLTKQKLLYSSVEGDYAQLVGTFDEAAVEEGQVSLVVVVDGNTYRAPVPAGESPRLFSAIVGDEDRPGFLVVQSGGDSSFATLYAFRGRSLVRVEPPAGVFFGSGFVEHGGEMREQRTWLTPGGLLFTAVALEPGSDRHQVWRWSDRFDGTLVRVDLGEVCIDWVTGDYGRCL